MNLSVHTISMTDGKPSCFYSTIENKPMDLEGYKAFIDPTEKRLVSVHEVKQGKLDGFSITWNTGGYAVELEFYVKGQRAYSYSFTHSKRRRVIKLSAGSVSISWDEQVNNPRERPIADSAGTMSLDYSKEILRPAIKNIAEMVHDKSFELREKANEVLGFEDYLRS